MTSKEPNLIPLADHKLAVAEAYRKAAKIVSRAGHSLDVEILALVDTDALADLDGLAAALKGDDHE